MLARRHREHPMAGTITPIYYCKGALPIPRYYDTNYTRLGRARRGKGDRSVTRPSEYFLEEPDLLGPIKEAIDKFIAERPLSNHPVVVSHWDGKLARGWVRD